MKYLGSLLIIAALLFVGCKKDNTKMLVQTYNVQLNASNSIPMPVGRTESGNIEMKLYDDNTLDFSIEISNLSATDALSVAHVHSGDVLTAGGVVFGLVDSENIAFTGNMASGTLTLEQEQVDALMGSDVYVNVHSNESPSGLVRGQIDQEIVQSYNIALSTENQIPEVIGRSETGEAYFRLVGNTLHYKVIVNDLSSTDQIVASHLHNGTASEAGSVFVGLAITDNEQLNINKSITLDETQIQSLGRDALYINVHSTEAQAGLLRGQLRN